MDHSITALALWGIGICFHTHTKYPVGRLCLHSESLWCLPPVTEITLKTWNWHYHFIPPIAEQVTTVA